MEDHDEVFKYKAINCRLLKSLKNSQIYFPCPEELNDPYDCQVDIESSLQRAFNDAKGERKEFLGCILKNANIERLHEMAQSIGVYSFSKSLLIPTMWSHYADEHRGVCLLYDFPLDFLNDSDKFLGATNVCYSDNALYEWLMHKLDTSFTTYESMKAILIRTFSVKGEAWSYERERRFIREERGPLEFDRTYLRQVCFGLKTPAKDRDRVLRVLDKNGYSEITRAKIVRDAKFDFKLTTHEL